jgi:hypothetical protein
MPGFRRGQLWFRNGNGRGASLLAESRHQSKIYTESKQSGFSANFRQINFNGNTCDLSTPASQEMNCEINRNETKRRPGSRDVFSASHGILARACARAAAQGKDARIGEAAAGGRVRSRIGCDRGGV